MFDNNQGEAAAGARKSKRSLKGLWVASGTVAALALGAVAYFNLSSIYADVNFTQYTCTISGKITKNGTDAAKKNMATVALSGTDVISGSALGASASEKSDGTYSMTFAYYGSNTKVDLTASAFNYNSQKATNKLSAFCGRNNVNFNLTMKQVGTVTIKGSFKRKHPAITALMPGMGTIKAYYKESTASTWSNFPGVVSLASDGTYTVTSTNMLNNTIFTGGKTYIFAVEFPQSGMSENPNSGYTGASCPGDTKTSELIKFGGTAESGTTDSKTIIINYTSQCVGVGSTGATATPTVVAATPTASVKPATTSTVSPAKTSTATPITMMDPTPTR